MSFELILVLFLLSVSISLELPNDDSSTEIVCENYYYDHQGNSELKKICNNIAITVDKPYKFSNPQHEWIAIMEIQNSTIPRIYKNTFSLNKDLIEIIIYNSGLTKIHHDDFAEMINVDQLNFTDNQISEVDAGAFIKNTQLVRLILKNNKLNSIKNLTSYPRLNYLDVSYNLITIIKANDFNKKFIPEQINLSNNQISEIEENAFLGLTSKSKLDLSYNFLHKLPSNFELIKINSLNIFHNKIKEIGVNDINQPI